MADNIPAQVDNQLEQQVGLRKMGQSSSSLKLLSENTFSAVPKSHFEVSPIQNFKRRKSVNCNDPRVFFNPNYNYNLIEEYLVDNNINQSINQDNDLEIANLNNNDKPSLNFNEPNEPADIKNANDDNQLKLDLNPDQYQEDDPSEAKLKLDKIVQQNIACLDKYGRFYTTIIFYRGFMGGYVNASLFMTDWLAASANYQMLLFYEQGASLEFFSAATSTFSLELCNYRTWLYLSYLVSIWNIHSQFLKIAAFMQQQINAQEVRIKALRRDLLQQLAQLALPNALNDPGKVSELKGMLSTLHEHEIKVANYQRIVRNVRHSIRTMRRNEIAWGGWNVIYLILKVVITLFISTTSPLGLALGLSIFSAFTVPLNYGDDVTNFWQSSINVHANNVTYYFNGNIAVLYQLFLTKLSNNDRKYIDYDYLESETKFLQAFLYDKEFRTHVLKQTISQNHNENKNDTDESGDSIKTGIFKVQYSLLRKEIIRLNENLQDSNQDFENIGPCAPRDKLPSGRFKDRLINKISRQNKEIFSRLATILVKNSAYRTPAEKDFAVLMLRTLASMYESANNQSQLLKIRNHIKLINTNQCPLAENCIAQWRDTFSRYTQDPKDGVYPSVQTAAEKIHQKLESSNDKNLIDFRVLNEFKNQVSVSDKQQFRNCWSTLFYLFCKVLMFAVSIFLLVLKFDPHFAIQVTSIGAGIVIGFGVILALICGLSRLFDRGYTALNAELNQTEDEVYRKKYLWRALVAVAVTLAIVITLLSIFLAGLITVGQFMMFGLGGLFLITAILGILLYFQHRALAQVILKDKNDLQDYVKESWFAKTWMKIFCLDPANQKDVIIFYHQVMFCKRLFGQIALVLLFLVLSFILFHFLSLTSGDITLIISAALNCCFMLSFFINPRQNELKKMERKSTLQLFTPILSFLFQGLFTQDATGFFQHFSSYHLIQLFVHFLFTLHLSVFGMGLGAAFLGLIILAVCCYFGTCASDRVTQRVLIGFGGVVGGGLMFLGLLSCLALITVNPLAIGSLALLTVVVISLLVIFCIKKISKNQEFENFQDQIPTWKNEFNNPDSRADSARSSNKNNIFSYNDNNVSQVNELQDSIRPTKRGDDRFLHDIPEDIQSLRSIVEL